MPGRREGCRSGVGLLALAVLPGCSPVEVRSPADGVTLGAPWTPVVVHAPARFEGGEVSVSVDGTPLGDPLALVRAAAGPGVDLLATLHLGDLEEGPHRLEARWRALDGEVATASSTFTVTRAPARVIFEVVDGAGQPTSARVLVRDRHGPVSLAGPEPAAADPSGRFTGFSSVFVTGGRGVVDLDPGTYTFVAVRGPREEIDQQTVKIDGDRTVSMVVPRVVDTPGQLLADLHVHTGRSGDSYLPDDPRFRSLLAAGIDVAVTTDHNAVTDVADRLEALVADGTDLRLVAGVEANIHDGDVSLGHFNAFPLATSDLPPDPSSPSVPAYIDAYALLSGSPLLQLNHPRGIQFAPDEALDADAHALFTRLGFDPGLPLDDPANVWLVTASPASGTRALDFDALEVANRFSRAGYRATRNDWFALMNQGWWLTGTGNSDSHALEVERAGFPANLVAVPAPAAGESLDTAAFVSALRGGRVTVSNGPVVDLLVETDDGDQGSPGDLVSGSGLTAHVRLRAAAWVPCRAVRLVVNGVVVAEVLLPDRAAGEALDYTASWPLSPAADAWVLAEAGLAEADLLGDEAVELPAPWRWVLPEYEPLAFTNPVRLDVDRDGEYTPGG